MNKHKLEEIIRALAALTKAVPGCHTVSTMCHAGSDFVRLSVGTDAALVSLSAVLDAKIETVNFADREWDVGLVEVGEIRVEVSGPHRDKRSLPAPQEVEIDGSAVAVAHAALGVAS